HSDEEHSDEEKDDDHDHSDEEHSDEEHSDEEHSDEEKDDDHDHSDEAHSDEEHSDEEKDDDHDHGDEHDGHDHSGADPHFFTDPVRMAAAVEGIVDFLQDEVDLVDPAALEASGDAYVAELTSLDAEVAELVASIPEDRRVLVTNHEVFGYFADRYGFEVVGAVVPSGSTTESVSAGELAELAEVVEAEGVPAIFADTSSSDELAQTLADEVGDIAVVELFSESLGDADSDGATYLAMVRTNADRISAALA
ncbi:MAG: metal ABC transporter substrate-binding protein, partial [Actinomycetota bacterium]